MTPNSQRRTNTSSNRIVAHRVTATLQPTACQALPGQVWIELALDRPETQPSFSSSQTSFMKFLLAERRGLSLSHHWDCQRPLLWQKFLINNGRRPEKGMKGLLIIDQLSLTVPTEYYNHERTETRLTWRPVWWMWSSTAVRWASDVLIPIRYRSTF